MKRSTRALVAAWAFTVLGCLDLVAYYHYDVDTVFGMSELLLGAVWFLIAEVRVWRERVL